MYANSEAVSSVSPELIERFAPARSPFSWNPGQFVSRSLASFSGRLLAGEPMSRYTAIKIGGPADLLCFPKTESDLTLLLRRAEEESIPVYVHGAGSNTLVRDGGIRGITVCLKDMSALVRILEETTESMTIEVDAGYSLHALVRFAAKQGLQGMACLAGIPASVGGALFMNAGVPGGTISDCLMALKIATAKEGQRWIPKEKLRLGYRRNELPSGAIVLAGRFACQKGDPFSIQQAVSEALEARKDKQPLTLPNLGSVFMNPAPVDQKSGKQKKLPTAGELIEDAGLKDVRVGGARISDKHANFIVNEGTATAKDVEILIRLIKDKVKEQTGIALKPEIKIIGEE